MKKLVFVFLFLLLTICSLNIPARAGTDDLSYCSMSCSPGCDGVVDDARNSIKTYEANCLVKELRQKCLFDINKTHIVSTAREVCVKIDSELEYECLLHFNKTHIIATASSTCEKIPNRRIFECVKKLNQTHILDTALKTCLDF